ncbi:DJ-1/PfpI family protein [Streptomyces albidoflavus]
MRIAFPLFDGFTALDLVGPYEIPRMLPGAEIALAGERAGQAVPDGVGGLGLVATHARAEVCAADVLLVPGGPGARRDVDDPALLEWITAVHATTRWTASVCTGALLLGAAGLLTGKSATAPGRRARTGARRDLHPRARRPPRRPADHRRGSGRDRPGDHPGRRADLYRPRPGVPAGPEYDPRPRRRRSLARRRRRRRRCWGSGRRTPGHNAVERGG